MTHATWVTEDKVIVLGRGILLRADIVAKETGIATATLHNGIDDAAPILAMLTAQAGNMRSISFTPGLELTEGLFVKLGPNTAGVLIEWDDRSEAGA